MEGSGWMESVILGLVTVSSEKEEENWFGININP